MSRMAPRGGARPGAGRPRGRSKTKALYVPMEPEKLAYYHELAASLGEQLAPLVRDLVAKWAEELEESRR